MGLAKSIETPFGITANYWKIAYINAHFVFGTMSVGVFGYADKTARDNGKEPLTSLPFAFDGIGNLEALTRTQVYDMIKADARFAGAIDE